MIKPVEIHSLNLCRPLILWVNLLLIIACETTPPVEGPPSLSASLSINRRALNLAHLIQHVASDPKGSAAIRRSLMVDVLSQRSKLLGGTTPPKDSIEWKDRLAEADQDDAILYAWASQLLHLKSMADESLKAKFKVEYPHNVHLVGRQINLSPKVAWTEDHYQRHLGSLRSAARLKLSQLRHQLIEGSRFEDLARTESHHSTHSSGGKTTIDSLRAEGVAPQILRVASELRAGEVSPVLQDKRGMYIFINESQKRPVSLDAEGIFLPQSSINAQLLDNKDLWSLLETLCDQSNQCELSKILPHGKIGRTWRESWRKHSSDARLSTRQRQKHQRRLKRLSRTAKGDTRALSGRERSWSSIALPTLEKVNAEYHAQIAPEVIQSLQIKNTNSLLERAPLFRTLPILFTEKGAWLIRLRGRTIIPVLSSPNLRMIYLNLTRAGLQKHWGTWGVDQIGKLLIEAAKYNRLDEALSTLGIQSTQIEPQTLTSALLNRLFDVSLDSGPRLITSTVNAKQKTQDWVLIRLEKKQKVSFEEVKEDLIKDLQREKNDPIALRRALKDVWENLEIQFFIDRQEIDLNTSDLRGFSR